MDTTCFSISRQVEKASNGQLPECRQNLLFNKVSYKELLSLFNLGIICKQSEQQNDTYRRGESGCNINKTNHPEVLREWYRIPIFIVRCTTPAQLTGLSNLPTAPPPKESIKKKLSYHQLSQKSSSSFG